MTPSHNSAIWVSELNARPEIRSAFSRSTVHFYDTTLRDGEQTVGVVLSPQQKLEIARKLDELGVSRIEAGFPRVSVDDADAVALMLKANLKAELWGFSRAIRGDLEELVRLGLRASVIEAPTSDIKLRAYRISAEEVLSRVKEAVSFAAQNGIRVAFFAVDGTRSRLDFLKEVYLSALEAGAQEIVVVDTIRACGPEAVEFLVLQVCERLRPKVPVHFPLHVACPEAIEPFSDDLVGARRQIVLGKKSGLDSIVLKAKELGLKVPESKRSAVLAAVKNKSIGEHRLVTDSEFFNIVQQICGK